MDEFIQVKIMILKIISACAQQNNRPKIYVCVCVCVYCLITYQYIKMYII